MIKRLICIVTILVLTASCVLAGGTLTSLDVSVNGMRIFFNNKEVKTLSADNILYNSTTYVPLKNVVRLSDKQANWSEAEPDKVYIVDEETSLDAILVPLVCLLANPMDYVGKTIMVTGYFIYGFENIYPFLSPYDCENLTNNRIRVNLPINEDHEK